MEKENSIQALDRAFQILELLSECGENVSLSEISVMTGISKSTAFRILKSLKENGYVSQNSYGQYCVSLKICTLSRKILSKTSIISIAQPHMKKLYSFTGRPVDLSMREGSEVVHIYRQEEASVPHDVVGKRMLLHNSAMGKSILATLSDEEIAAYWKKTEKPQDTPFTIMNLDELMRDVAETRQRGYAIANQENVLGIRCAAVAIRNYIGAPSYAVSVSFPFEELSDERLEKLIPFLFTVKNSIETSLGTQRS